MRKTEIISKRKRIYDIVFVVIILFISSSIVYISFNPPKQDKHAKETILPETDSWVHDKDNNLPILVIDTKGKKIQHSIGSKKVKVNDKVMNISEKSPKYKANLKLYEPNIYGYISISHRTKPTLDTDIIINIRGQSSLFYPKKQYTIRLVDENNMENPKELLGMPSHDKWVLNGSYSDKSLLRNYIAYKMGRQIMEYAPGTRFVEVYLNDSNGKTLTFDENYMGVYLLTEKIERDKNRVHISKNNDKYKDISFIIARDKVKIGDTVLQSDWDKLEEEYIMIPQNILKMRTKFTVIYPNQKNITEIHTKKIIDYINEFEYSLRSNKFNDRKEGYAKYIDIDSFIKYAIINEITKNIDGGEVSTYFYKDLGGTMKAGPVWDFDQSLGNTSVKEVNEPTGFRMFNTIWYDRLFQDEYFANRYKIMYKKYRNTIWTDANIHKMIDEALLELGPAIERNQRKWYKKSSIEDYDKEVEDIKKFLKERFSWIDHNINLIKRIKENAVK